MTDALNAEPLGPQTDTLVEQAPDTQPLEVKDTDAKQSLDDILKAETEKAVKGETPKKDGDDKADDKAKAEEKPAEKAKDEPKPKADAEANAEGEKADDAKDTPDDELKDEAPKKPTAYKDPPKGFDDAAKKDWESVPETVRGAMHRRAQEMESGIHKYRQDAEQFDEVREYAEMAKQGGTDLKTALSRYVNMENALRQNPMQGLQAVMANLGLKKSDGTPITLRDVAATVMGQSPDQAASQQEATINGLRQTIQSLQEQIGGVSKHMEAQETQQRTQTAQSEWDAFQRDNPRAQELEADMAKALQMQNPDAYPSLTERLRHAYAVAEAQNPTVAHTDTPPLAQTQPETKAANPAGQKSVRGSSGESRKTRKMSSDEVIKKTIAGLRQ